MNSNDQNQQIQSPVTQGSIQGTQPVSVPQTQIPQQAVQPVSQPAQAPQPVQQPAVAPVQPIIPVQSEQPVQMPQPVSVPQGKESAGVSIPKPPEQWIQETAPVAEVAPEVKDAGVEVVQGEVANVHPAAAASGVQPVGLAAPVPAEPTLDFPMTEEKAEGILKMHKKVKDSIYWLAMLIVRQFKLLHFKETHKEEEVAA